MVVIIIFCAIILKGYERLVFVKFLVGSGLLIWLIQKLIEFFLNKRIEIYKLELQKQHDEHKQLYEREIKIFEYNMQLVLNNQSKLYEEVILKIYPECFKKVTNLERSMRNLIIMHQVIKDADEEEKERIIQAANTFNDFEEYFDENRIYFNDEICQLIVNLIEKCRIGYNTYSFRSVWNLPSNKDSYEEYKEAAKLIEGEVPHIKKSIAENFRKIISIK
jgi:hypothetical protein